ncbi:MAG TPA: cobalamin-independent methionine synthase II family protein [Chloroflexota bacterium]|nr:cobalamin-independent methionine synthase II family protein [Chloroflexota bacterium]
MKRSTERILTTHTGSLPRPNDLAELMLAKEAGQDVDPARLEHAIQAATTEVVRQQVACGVDVVGDGEMSKPGYSNYVKDRLTGLSGQSGMKHRPEWEDFPEYYQLNRQDAARANLRTPACTGPVRLRDPEAVQRDIARLRAALDALGDARPVDVFMTAASPGVIAHFLENQYYGSDEAYLAALADAMRPEYEAIAAAGFVLQLDCPDLAMSRHMGTNADLSTEQFRTKINLQVEALNHTVARIPAEQLRLHLCWGNYEGPHHRDIPLRDILDVVLRARPSAISFEGANPRHGHEWALFEEVKLPEGKMLIPGVLDSTTNYVEHPELVAQRIVRYARLVGRENVIAGSDCGFGTFVGRARVDRRITWAKLEAMADGARLASQQLWG